MNFKKLCVERLKQLRINRALKASLDQAEDFDLDEFVWCAPAPRENAALPAEEEPLIASLPRREDGQVDWQGLRLRLAKLE